MRKTRRPGQSAQHYQTGVRRAVLYARVSSKEQDREGFSIDAQLKLLRTYAADNEMRIVEEFVDVETAKAAGRTHFNQMIAYIRRHPAIDTILVEKTDRLYRNLRDWVTLDEFDIDVHLVKEGVVLSPDSKSSEKFMHGIKVLMAKNYIDNLSEESRKGMLEKAEQGIWPSMAPLGYRNVMGPHGKKIIEIDPDTAPGVTRLFEWYATGRYSLKEAGKKARAIGMAYRKSGKPLGVSTVHKILRSRIYTGEFEWAGRRYQGSHEPLVSMDLWEKVQEILDGRNHPRDQVEEKGFLFPGLITCGHCGGMLVGDIKKQKYIYYRCSRYKGNCKEPYVRQEKLLEQFVDIVARVSMTPRMHQWLGQALKENSDLIETEHARVLGRLRRDQDDIRERMKQAYLDHVDGKLDEGLFTRISEDYREDLKGLSREFDRLSEADNAYIDDGIALLGIAKDARRMFAEADFSGKRNILHHLLSNCSYKDGEVSVSFRKPFDIIVESLPAAKASDGASSAKIGKSRKWLPG